MLLFLTACYNGLTYSAVTIIMVMRRPPKPSLRQQMNSTTSSRTARAAFTVNFFWHLWKIVKRGCGYSLSLARAAGFFPRGRNSPSLTFFSLNLLPLLEPIRYCGCCFPPQQLQQPQQQIFSSTPNSGKASRRRVRRSPEVEKVLSKDETWSWNSWLLASSSWPSHC